MGLYENLASTALTQIADKGRSVTYRVKSDGTYNPATGARTGQTITETTVNMAFINYNRNEIDGEVIKTGDVKGLLASGVTPKPADEITDGTTIWRVINVNEIKPANVSVMYKLQLRQLYE